MKAMLRMTARRDME